MARFTKQAQNAINIAKNMASDFKHEYVGTEHLLVGLLEETESVASIALINQGIQKDVIIEKVKNIQVKGSNSKLTKLDFTPKCKHILEDSIKQALNGGTIYVGTEHILLSILQEKDCVAVKVLLSLNIMPKKIQRQIEDVMGELSSFSNQTKGDNQKTNDSNTPTLDQYSKDFTKMAKEQKFDPIIGRDKEIQRIIQILSRRTKNNPCLIGEPGVGKTAIVEGLAQKIIMGNVPETIKGMRVVALDLSLMVAGAKYRGEFEERINKSLQELKVAGNILLFIDELHTIIGAGAAEGAIDASSILKPSLARGEIQLIGATTIEEYRKHIEKDSALERRFQPVTVEEPTEEEAIQILKGLKEKYEVHHNVKIEEEAIIAAVKLSKRYISDRFLPDKAIDLIDEAASKVRLTTYVTPPKIKNVEEKLEELSRQKELAITSEQYEQAGEIKKQENKLIKKLETYKTSWKEENENNNQIVREQDIADIISSWTGIQVKKLAQNESERLRNMEGELHKRIIGQDEAVTAVSKAIRRGRIGLKDPNRPIGSFLFLGPTGVGKTELCKTLAEALFGDEKALLRVDMSEYMEKHSVSKLIGSPPGYVGYDAGGNFSEKIRRKPYSIVLFDEIEKAHPDVFNILLQVLDDGHITDSQGRKVDFKNTVIIMTSNVGARNIIDPKKLGFASEVDEDKKFKDMKSNVLKEIKKLFRPEFINRIDEMIVFHPLTKENIAEIVGIMINVLSKRTIESLGITLKVTDKAKELLAKEGYDKAYGARPLRRTIQSKVEDVLAEKILDFEIEQGDKVTIGIKNEKLSFNKITRRV